MTQIQYIQSAIIPKTRETISLGDRVVISQGRFGHNNIITVKTIFKFKEQIYVSANENSEQGTYIESVKRKITNEEIAQMQKDKAAGQIAERYNIIN